MRQLGQKLTKRRRVEHLCFRQIDVDGTSVLRSGRSSKTYPVCATPKHQALRGGLEPVFFGLWQKENNQNAWSSGRLGSQIVVSFNTRQLIRQLSIAPGWLFDGSFQLNFKVYFVEIATVFKGPPGRNFCVDARVVLVSVSLGDSRTTK